MPREFTQLPNGDIWYPPGSREGDERKDTAGPEAPVVPDAREEAIARGNADPLRPNMLCPWCAQEFPDEEIFNEHVKLQHASALGLSAETAREVEGRHIMREKAQRTVDERESPSGESVAQEAMDAAEPVAQSAVDAFNAREREGIQP
jgi:hypothetical protein